MVGDRWTFKPRSGGMVLVNAEADARMDVGDSLGEGWRVDCLVVCFVVRSVAQQERVTGSRPISASTDATRVGSGDV